jgi:two-component system OmpR family sensor kinase
MSLRARLIATLLALAAVGMVALASITYATQRSYQEDRINDQARAAEPAVGRELDERGARVPGAPRFPSRPHGEGRGPGGPDPSRANLPPGTHGERRDANGRRLGSFVLSYGGTPLPPPKLPARLGPGELLTVPAQGGGDLRYRVRSFPNPGGRGVTIVALPLNGVRDTLRRLLIVEGLVIVAVLTLLAVLASALVRLGLRPLERIGRTAGAIAAGDLSRRVDVATPRTEVGRLGLALNAMLSRLEQAFAEREASEGRLRRFLSDASHELRTPLASIRGYAELYRIGAARSPQEAEKAMRRIEDEAARMGLLVEDMLVLARLDETREPVAEEVDVAALAQDAAADARAVDPERRISVHGDGEAVVLGDPDQLRQVLANLVRNALVHTPPATAVEITSRRDGDHVALEVRDHGRGLPTDRPEALFERFWRAEGGRERGPAGAGLGLAIVAGIVAAHGGEVAAADAPGGGASFVVRLPLYGGAAVNGPGLPSSKHGSPSSGIGSQGAA